MTYWIMIEMNKIDINNSVVKCTQIIQSYATDNGYVLNRQQAIS